MKRSLLSAMCSLLFLPGVVCAEMYVWVDGNGVKHYSNVAPSDPQTAVEQREELEYDETTAAYYEALQREQEERNAQARQASQERIAQEQLAGKEARERQAAEKKIGELEHTVTRMENDLTTLKKENDRDTVIISHPRGYDHDRHDDRKKHVKPEKPVPPPPQPTFSEIRAKKAAQDKLKADEATAKAETPPKIKTPPPAAPLDPADQNPRP